MNKESAIHFLKQVVSGEIDEAYAKYVDLSGKHHNAYFPAGFPALREAMKENHSKFPHKQFEVKRVIAEGDWVVTHSHLRMNAEDQTGKVAVHLFRFKNGKIVEMWDCGMPIPENSPNRDGVI